MCFRPAAVEIKKTCPECGAENEPTASTCEQCGAELARLCLSFCARGSRRAVGSGKAGGSQCAGSAGDVERAQGARRSQRAGSAGSAGDSGGVGARQGELGVPSARSAPGRLRSPEE